MTEKQKELLLEMSRVYMELSAEYDADENFQEVMMDNADLYTMSLDEISDEWAAAAHGER